jgi:hypothetical protein
MQAQKKEAGWRAPAGFRPNSFLLTSRSQPAALNGPGAGVMNVRRGFDGLRIIHIYFRPSPPFQFCPAPTVCVYMHYSQEAGLCQLDIEYFNSNKKIATICHSKE